MFELSVIKPSLQAGIPLYFIISRATYDLAIGKTSIGSGNFPRISTILESSTMHKNFFDAPAMIFSLVSAPPPPFISCKLLFTSSAPSI